MLCMVHPEQQQVVSLKTNYFKDCNWIFYFEKKVDILVCMSMSACLLCYSVQVKTTILIIAYLFVLQLTSSARQHYRDRLQIWQRQSRVVQKAVLRCHLFFNPYFVWHRSIYSMLLDSILVIIIIWAVI